MAPVNPIMPRLRPFTPSCGWLLAALVPLAVLAAGLDAGAELSDALHYASVAGGLACERAGAMASPPAHR